MVSIKTARNRYYLKITTQHTLLFYYQFVRVDSFFFSSFWVPVFFSAAYWSSRSKSLLWNIFFYQRQQRCMGTFITASLTEKGPCKKYWPCNLQLAFGNLQEKRWGPLQRIYIGNHFDQTSLREDSSLLFCFLLDFTLFYVKGFWTVGFQEFGGHLIREHSNDLAVQLPLRSRQQWQLGKDKSVFLCGHGECQEDAEGSPSKWSWMSCYLWFHTNFPGDFKDLFNFLRVLHFGHLI